MMEVERVDCVAQLKSRVFCADQRHDESLLEFIDRVADRHQIFCIAYPTAPRDDVALLNRVIQCMDNPEYGVQMIMRNAINLADARELIRTLNLPSLHTKANKSRGVYAVESVPTETKTKVSPSVEDGTVRSDMDAMKVQMSYLVRAISKLTFWIVL